MSCHSALSSVRCLAAMELGGDIQEHRVTRRDLLPSDVSIRIEYCGICHSDVSQIHGEFGGKNFPLVPGHEIVGTIQAIGPDVRKFKVGDKVGIGCMCDSCRQCSSCHQGLENYCVEGPTMTYNCESRVDGSITYGGYSERIVCDENFVVSIPDPLSLAEASPLLCAGITTYSPLMEFGLRPNHRLAIAGLGGLGHLGVKFGVAFGAHVTVLSRGEKKRKDALNLGAHDYIDTTNQAGMKRASGSFDFILDCIGVDHDIDSLLQSISVKGTLIMVGIPPKVQFSHKNLRYAGRRVGGSLIGGIRETQEMLEFCARHKITSEIEMVQPKPDDINQAYKEMLKANVKYRFVIDMTKF